MTGPANDGLWTASKVSCVTRSLIDETHKKLQGGELWWVVSSSSRATSEYDLLRVDELLQHPKPDDGCKYLHHRCDRSPGTGAEPPGAGPEGRQVPGQLRGSVRGRRGWVLRRGLKECAGYLSALKSGYYEGVCHPGRMKNGWFHSR